ncbi:MAG: alpha/beta fold hydrolase [Candidatus Midichloria sp.]|uniref:Alpha/beta hydrolase n=1 Tax=Hyalomma marginatum TaxID=34627 RepID=A0A8S4BWM8_9ACAR|nr:alpha/beta hydrolase [Hyalomma marginatum]CAG7598967.1 alpha/beta hydrolase [Hyalomma marginatum]
MKLGFIFSHGWAFNKSYWDNLLPHFEEYPCIVLDHGYYRSEYLPQVNEKIHWIGVGHSLGLVKLLQSKTTFKALIGLQAFNNFLASDKSLNRRRTLELAIMKKNFNENPQNTIESFNGIVATNIDFYRITNDLNLLSYTHESLFEKFMEIPILILYTADDEVVPVNIIEENFKHYPNVQLKKMPNSKHLLGCLNSKQVAISIKEFLKCF